ncbi:hypothetical protein TSOC_002824 [Tetrabaena socialis]|uniref:CFA20 domain-containing protein n=1 Tax=Tetrabaena socialis TaxID=47790 RepID=A0A2J8AD34_9CHLO|nr:hypothetical protein TSOC_002824 [Tetrabaena socialis]|eukprot:PNH10430.1 hypothetical protein TSOC_002824 [Tetrabaena socialis]
MALFGNEYQGGPHVDVLGTHGQNPLGPWKVSGPQKGVQKVYDKTLKGYVFVCSGGCRMVLPRDDRAVLGLVQPHLLLQLEISMGAHFSLEVGLTDASGTRRRVILSSSFSELKCTPLHCQVVGEVEESIALDSGVLWGGFGVDEDDDMLGSRHFREQRAAGEALDLEAAGGVVRSGPSFGPPVGGGGGGGYEGVPGYGSTDRSPPSGGGGGGGPPAAAAAAAAAQQLQYNLPPMGAGGPSPPSTAAHGTRGPPARWPSMPAAGGGGVEEGLSPPRPPLHPHNAAGPLSPPIRCSGARVAPPPPPPPPPAGGGGANGGVREGEAITHHHQSSLYHYHMGDGGVDPPPRRELREATFAGFVRRDGSHGGDGGYDPLLDEDALLAGHMHDMDAYDNHHHLPYDHPRPADQGAAQGQPGQPHAGGASSDWGRVDQRPTPADLRNDHRAFTPPVIPASKALGLALGGGPGGAAGAQVLRVGGGAGGTGGGAGGGVVAPAGGEAMLDVVYDPVLNCYYDGATGQYYELKK